MTLTLQLQDQTAQALLSQAAARGLTLEAYLAELAKAHEFLANGTISDVVSDFDQALEELFVGDTRELPPMPLGHSRDDITN